MSGFDSSPDVHIGDDWVAVRWSERGPFTVLDRAGQLTERFTLPATDGPAALPLPSTGGAA